MDTVPPQYPLHAVWSLPLAQVYEQLQCSSQGLKQQQAELRIQSFGPNRIQLQNSRSFWAVLLAQLKSIMVLFLFAACLFSLFLGDHVEAIAILVVIFFNTLIGFVTELRAVRSMEALRLIGSVTTRVMRDGELRSIVADALVPGDVVLLEGGDVVTADLRVIDSSRLQLDESTLTGESVPVSKDDTLSPVDGTLVERKNMLYRGTSVTRGSVTALVVATAMDTELGHIAAMVEQGEEDELTPLEQRLDTMGRNLIWLTLVLTLLVTLSGVLAGKSLWLMIQTGIALAVAAIPEGLPVVATLALARGMWRMAKRHALINKLSAVETLGATSVICTDKTGTLTENRMTVQHYALSGGDVHVTGEGLSQEGGFYQQQQRLIPADLLNMNEALRIGVLCSNATLKQQQISGDPLEVALLIAAAKAGMSQQAARESWPELMEEAFDPVNKMMATYHQGRGQIYVAVKGGPEAVIKHCTSILDEQGHLQEMTQALRQQWLKRNEEMASGGLRVLAVARKQVAEVNAPAYEALSLVALVGMQDPPRAEVAEAIADCQKAGIRVVMVTGDQEHTARSVAAAVGLESQDSSQVIHGERLDTAVSMAPAQRQEILACNIFCRVSPEQKLSLIAMHQQAGSVVAMTGDGVNDAPALKKADIGVAMGQRGTQVAREAADMVLKDDSFATITLAVEQGRVIFNNIRRFVVYLLSCNLSEVMIVGFAALLNAPLPLLPMQILFLNLVTDVFPALALGMGEGDKSMMQQPPRSRQESLLTQAHWWTIALYGLLITVSVLIVFFSALYWFAWPEGEAITMSFLCIAFAQLWHVFNMRQVSSRWWKNDVVANVYIWLALGLCSVLILSYLLIPILAKALSLQALSLQQWLIVMGMSLVPYVIGQNMLGLRRIRLPAQDVL
ncbi:MAG: cation-transporting P-type ATPase [Gammaproteobacteria bacterium]|nr:cation-transporting P-type ATPase [Gammaproteobacteria bacterium]